MPNWCMNQVELKASEQELKAFVKALVDFNKSLDKEDPKDFSILGAFAPLPESTTAFPSDATEHWGTKWADHAYLDEESYAAESINFRLETAWSPPIEGLLKVSKRWPSIRFILTYREDGMAFAGSAIIYCGKLLFEREWNLDEGSYPTYPDPDDFDSEGGFFLAEEKYLEAVYRFDDNEDNILMEAEKELFSLRIV